MLNFGMEMQRINDIIKKGAESRMTDTEFLEKEIGKFLASPSRRDMIMGDAYYDYEQAIKDRKRMVIKDSVGEDGHKKAIWQEDTNLPNNRDLDNQYAKMVDQKVNYLLSKPLTFQCDNETYTDALKKIFNKRFQRTLKNLGKDAYNGGIGWLYPYYDENGEFRIKRFKPWEILPFWKDDEHTELDFAVRIYNVLMYEGNEEKVITNVDVYDTQGIHHFTYDGLLTEGNKLIKDYSTYHFEVEDEEQADGQIEGYNWNRVPLIPFKAYSNEMPLIKKVKPLQDAINRILSDFDNSMEENASGNTIIVLKNYGGTDLGEFRRNLSEFKAIKVRSTDGADGGVDKLEIEVNCENYKTILALLKKALIENAKGYDVDELKSAGSPNEMTIKSVYSDIDIDADETETEFQASFEDLLWFVNQHLSNAHIGDFENEEVDVVFNRSMLVVESDIINNIKNSVGILSTETLISKHPWSSDNPQKEIDRLKKEKQEQQEEMEQQMYGNAFAQGNEDDKKNNEDFE